MQSSFQFGGVHCGALATIKFQLSNKVKHEQGFVVKLVIFLNLNVCDKY